MIMSAGRPPPPHTHTSSRRRRRRRESRRSVADFQDESPNDDECGRWHARIETPRTCPCRRRGLTRDRSTGIGPKFTFRFVRETVSSFPDRLASISGMAPQCRLRRCSHGILPIHAFDAYTEIIGADSRRRIPLDYNTIGETPNLVAPT